MHVGMGPAHPAMHGIIRIVTELDGENIRKADVEIGYLHRAFEKDCEVGGWNNAIPYTDRLNYVSPLINNFAYASAVEKLLGIEVTERCKYIRTIMAEISRICDHLTCVGASAMELGAFTVFLYMIKAREFLWELVEDVTGARLTISYGRVGGVKADLPDGFADQGRRTPSSETREVLDEVHRLLTGNRIFMDRMVGVGALSREETIAYAITGSAAARGRRALRRAPGAARTGPTTASSSRCRPRRTATTTRATSCAWPRWSSRCGSPSRRSAAMPGGPVNVDFEGRPIDPAAYVDQGKQGKTEGLLLVPITPVAEPAGPGPARARAGERRPTSAWCCRRRRPPTAPSRG